MKIIKGDIFKGEHDAIAHGCNIYNTWGAGFVLPLQKFYPQAHQADLKTKKGDEGKYGGFSFAEVDGKIIYNLYTQIGIGNNGHPMNRNLQYDYLYNSLYNALTDFCHPNVAAKRHSHVFALPYLIGCGLAGGSERIVLSIIEELEFMHKDKGVEFHLFDNRK